jgi:hypothetical protein
MTRIRERMKTQLPPATLRIVSGVFSARTSVKRDDPSYTYILQQNPVPQMQAVESVTAHEMRTRTFAGPGAGPLQ